MKTSILHSASVASPYSYVSHLSQIRPSNSKMINIRRINPNPPLG